MRTGHVCRTGRQDDHILDTRRLRRACRRQRNKPHPLAGSCRQRKTLGTGQCLGHEQRAAPCGGIRRVVRRSGRRCPVLGRRHVPQDGRGAHGVDPPRRGDMRRPSARDPRRGLADTAAGRHTAVQHLHVQPHRRRGCRRMGTIAMARHVGADVGYRVPRRVGHRSLAHRSVPDVPLHAAQRTRRGLLRCRGTQKGRPQRGCASCTPQVAAPDIRLRTSAPQRSCSAGSQSPMR